MINTFSWKRFVPSTLLTSGTLAWGFLLQTEITDIYTRSANPFLEYIDPVLFYLFAGISALVGIFIKRKSTNRKFLLSWVTLGVATTLLLPMFSETVFKQLLSIMLGFSLGLGLPISMAFIADSTSIGERGRVAGITISMTFGLAIIVTIIQDLFIFELPTLILLFAILRSISYVTLFTNKFDKEYGVCKESRSTTEYKDFISYTIPWIIFILVGTLAWNLFPMNLYPSAVAIGTPLRFCNIAAFGLISGFIADRFGRRPSIIIGQLIIGTSFAILGFFGIFYSSVIIYLTASGVAWGLILTMYLTIPGDLSVCGAREKLYSLLVVLPIILMLSVPFFPITIDFTKYSSPFSQLLALVNFFSIIPLIFLADDTLKKEEIEKIKMKDYAELAGRLLSDSSNNN